MTCPTKRLISVGLFAAVLTAMSACASPPKAPTLKVILENDSGISYRATGMTLEAVSEKAAAFCGNKARRAVLQSTTADADGSQVIAFSCVQ